MFMIIMISDTYAVPPFTGTAPLRTVGRRFLYCCIIRGQISSPFCNTSLAAFLFLSNAWV